MSRTNLGAEKKGLITFRAGGRCEFDGCNEYLLKDNLTQIEFNDQQYAHIIAESPNGPRGQEDSKEYAGDVDNIILLCPKHHHLVDTQPEKFPKELLQAMKKNHEDRVQRLLNIRVDKQRTIVIYHANIGSNMVNLPYENTVDALWPESYPSAEYIEIGLKNSFMTENEPEFWVREKEYLEKMVQHKVIERIDGGAITKMALFALAPMPLLVRLGTLLPDKYDVEVYQKHREPDTWKWLDEQVSDEFVLKRPEKVGGEACLIFSISADIRNRVESQFPNASLWEITVPNPGLDFLRMEKQLSAFRQITRMALKEIKDAGLADIKVFMAMPNACAVEVGRVWMPKADLPMHLYDYNRSISQVDRYVFTIENF